VEAHQRFSLSVSWCAGCGRALAWLRLCAVACGRVAARKPERAERRGRGRPTSINFDEFHASMRTGGIQVTVLHAGL